MTLGELLREGIARLKAAGIQDAAGDARRLLAEAAGVPRDRLTLSLPEDASSEVRQAFDRLIARRCRRVPVSHLLGWRDFYGRRFGITGDVLDPRPETETLVEAALADPFATVLDLGTGSGCILLSLLAERGGASGTGTDISQAALAVAGRNAEALGLSGRCRLDVSDWFGAVEGWFDLVVSNPPYITADEMAGLQPELAHEPRIALTDEGDGLSAYRRIAAGAGTHLASGGRLMVEIGWWQGAAVAQIFAEAGLEEVTVLPDLDGHDRVVWGRRSPDVAKTPRFFAE